MISPVWWNDVPAILKGFIDKVMKMDFAYEVTKTGVKGKLTNVQEAVVITTATSPTWYLRWFLGNPIGKIFVNRTLKQLGFQKRKWIHFGGITNSHPSKREKFLQDIIHKI
jgi:NAD(P)H dehydrogenase (quinone)